MIQQSHSWAWGCMLSPFGCVRLFAACQVPLPVQFCRQEYWQWVAMPSSKGSSRPRDLTSPALAGGFFTTSATGKPTPGHISRQNYNVKRYCTPVLTAALSTGVMDMTRKQPQCSSMDEWMDG